MESNLWCNMLPKECGIEYKKGMPWLPFNSHELSNTDLTSERTLPDLFFNTDATWYWTLLIWLWFNLTVAWKVLTCFNARIYASSTNFGLTNTNSCWYTKVGMKEVNNRDSFGAEHLFYQIFVSFM